MSSVQVLLSGLQDPRRTTAEGCRTILLDLLTICRYDEPKAELIRSGGLDILAEFVATEILVASAFVDVMDVVLELVVVLVTENTHLAKTRIVERPPLLTLPLHCIRVYSQRKSSNKRNKLFRMALELLDVISFTETSRRTAHSEQVILTLLRVMENPEEEPCLLQIVTEMLVCYLEGNSTGIHFAAKFNAITILLRLVTTPSERQDAKRSALEALLVIADVKDLIPIILANNAVHVVGGCLRGRYSSSCHRTEYAALRLLLRLAEHSQIYGQMVNEDMIPWFFQLIERHTPHHLDIIKVACSLLDGIAAFAHNCKLDLSPFIYKGPPCRGLVLVQAANEHGHEPSLVASVFRFFVHVARNPVELPMVLNSETIEGLLSLYVHSSGTSSSYRAEISTYLVRFVTLLSRSTIETITLKNEDLSLPALFLCLRRHTSDLRFASQVFAIVTKNWRARSTPPRSAHSIAGFVAIAVQLLRDHAHITAHSHWVELMELYNFLREVLVSKDGGQVVLACGGKVLYAVLQERSDGSQSSLQLRPNSETAAGDDGDVQGRAAVKGMIEIVLKMLGDVISTTDLAVTDSSKDSMRGESRESRRLRSQHSGRFHNGDVQYSSYIEDVMRRERSCVFRPATADPGMDPGEVGSMVDEEDDSLDGENEAACQQFDDDSGEHGEPGDVSGEVEEEEDIVVEGNDDDSDGAEDTEQVVLPSTPAQNSLAQLTQRDSSPTPRDGSRVTIADLVAPECLPRHLILPAKELKSIDYVELEEMPFFYVDHRNGIQYPRHPYRARHSESSSSSSSSAARPRSAPKLLVDESPAILEPSRAPDPTRLASFVEQATQRRQQFINADPSGRARMVYENAAVYEAGGSDSATRVHLTGGICQLQHLYSVPETTKAFAQAPVLTFDSHFESGNLEQAIQIGEYEYDLVLRRDLHTTGNMQWFYFAVSNIPSAAPPGGTKYRFNIINLCKPDSLFNQGLQPVLYSVKDAQRRGIGWRRFGEDIYYFPNLFTRPCKNSSSTTKTTDPATDNQGNDGDNGFKAESTSPGGFYTLTFTLTFDNPGDTYLIAHSYPYTFTDHQRHLAHILQAQRISGRRSPQILRHNVLCSTVSGRPCDVLTITDFSVGPAELRSRKAIILTARVHPGEAQASWIMRGIIDFLLSNSDSARILRRLFVFTIVPMLNPDGVFYGNSRCSLSACDLNRQWHQPSQDAHPTIYHTKELIRREFSSRGIVFFCDIHGHSRKKNVFLYGCDTKKRPNPRARAFARLFSLQPTAKRYISFLDCSFKVSKDKETTARVVLSNEFRLSWCFTLEASFCGASFGELQDSHFNTKHLQQVGRALCESLFHACVSEGALRERLLSLVDDRSISLVAYIENSLLESGLVSDPNSLQEYLTATQTTTIPASISSLRKSKSTSKKEKMTSKPRRRRTTSMIDEEKRQMASQLIQKAITRRSNGKQKSGISRRRSSPATDGVAASAQVSTPGEEKNGPRRSSKLIATRRITDGTVARSSAVTALLSKSPPIVDILRSLEAPDEEDSQLYRLQSIVRAGNRATGPDPTTLSASSSTASTPPETPPQPILPYRPFNASHRRLQSGDQPTARTGSTTTSGDSPTAIFSFALRDAVPVVLPPPVGDIARSRSPKPPHKNVRFKGAGRQYAAISPTKNPSIGEIMRHNTLANAAGYEPELIQAAAIALRQRGASTSVTDSPNIALSSMMGASPMTSSPARAVRFPTTSTNPPSTTSGPGRLSFPNVSC